MDIKYIQIVQLNVDSPLQILTWQDFNSLAMIYYSPESYATTEVESFARITQEE